MTSTANKTRGEPAPARPPAELELRSVSKLYAGPSQPAIPDLSLVVPAGEICVLVGPSGSGKTTALRLVNRMIELTSGDILIGGESVLSRPPNELRRDIGYVIQQIGLFPHLTVAENVATVPRLLGWNRRRTEERVDELFDLIGLDRSEVGDRYPAQLSGGQRQRIGVARALAADPPVLLMDEPFGAIDPISRSRLQDEFLALQARVRRTVVFVTHDIGEALKLGDRIAILRKGGELAQYGTPEEILSDPADEFVAEFVGEDRQLKLLSLKTVADVVLEPVAKNQPADRPITRTTSLSDALSHLLAAGGKPLTVSDAKGKPVGTLTLSAVTAVSGHGATPTKP